jgi:hypothetical protein
MLAFEPGFAGAEADLDLVIAGNRAHGKRKRALERLGRGFSAFRGLAHLPAPRAMALKGLIS